MATTYQIKKGDTLTSIAKKYNTTVTKLVTWNNIKNKNKIYAGDTIYVSDPKGVNSVALSAIDVQNNADRTLYVTWAFGKSNVDKYTVKWEYATGDGVWFEGSSSDVTVKQSVYSPPANAIMVRVRVKPISTKDKKVNGKETYHWTGSWCSWKEYTFKEDPSEKPSVPTLTADDTKGFKLVASVTNINEFYFATHIRFQFVKIDGAKETKAHTSDPVKIGEGRSAIYYYTVPSYGCEYKVRCYGLKINKNGKWVEDSDWTDFSSAVGTPPKPIGIFTKIEAISSTEVRLDWQGTSTADKYEIEWTTDKRYFNSSNEVHSMTVENDQNMYEGGVSHAEVTGLEPGHTYYFRIRAVAGNFATVWSSTDRDSQCSITIGMKPSAPTTWSSSTTVMVGGELSLYWIHNSRDNSVQTKAELELTIGGVVKDPYVCSDCGIYKIDSSGKLTVVKKYVTDEDKTKNNQCVIITDGFTEGTEIKWRVRTMGISREEGYSDWSVQRTVNIYAQPYFEIFQVTNNDGETFDVLEHFPFYFKAIPGPPTQIPIGYHVSVTANESYDSTDELGNEIIINEGDVVYSRFFDISTDLLVEFSAGNIDLEPNREYTLTCIVSMNSGLTATEKTSFTVNWEDELYTPNAEIHFNEETYSTAIRPYCGENPYVAKIVMYDATDGTYTLTDDTIDNVEGDDWVEDAELTNDEALVFKGADERGVEVYYSLIPSDTIKLTEGVTLSVYRREFDGTFTEIASGLPNEAGAYVSDPHPALDFARYRIVATSDATGAVSFYDIENYPIGVSSIIIQWDEQWTNFEVSAEDELVEPPWSGSLLKLPYNIDISDNYSPDVSLIEYIGREHPVSYYGTQVGSTASWNVEIPKDDIETLYALRRLARWMGDVYVREPSGSGYWAHITVSFSQTHLEVTIPVSLSITRVEGGM